MMKAKERESTIETIAKYSSSKYYEMVLSFFGALIKPKLLTPELFGLWNILTLIPRYSGYTDLGTHSIMRYLIPYHDAKNEQEKVSNIKRSIFSGVLSLKILIVLIIVPISLIGKWDLKVRLGLLTMAYLVIMEWYYDYYISILKSHQEFSLITSTFFLKSTVAFLGSVFLIYFFSIYGVYLSAILTFIVIISYLMKRYPLHFHSNFQLSLFISLIKRGGPLLIFTIITGLISTSDRIITSYFLGNKQLGYYSIAIMVFNFIMQVPGASRDIIEPKLMQELDKKPVEYNLNEYFFKPLINTAYYTPFLVGTAVIILPPFISLILPRYLPGILPAQIVVLGAYFYSVSYMARGVIVANNWQGEVSFFMVFVLIINIFLNILLIKLGLGLIGVAFSTALSYFILFVLLLSFIRLKYRGRIKNWGKNIEGILWPFPIMFLLLIISKYFLKGISTNRYFGSIINLFIFYICMIIVFKLAQKRYILLKGINLRERG